MRAIRPLCLASLLFSASVACNGATTDGLDSRAPDNGNGGNGAPNAGGGPVGRAGSAGSTEPGKADPQSEPAASCAGLAGTWKGYIESFAVDGSDRLEIILAPGVDTCVVGSASFGDGAPLPPATNPDVGYPDGVADPAVRSTPIHSGFAYTLKTSRLDAQRLRFSMASHELWAGWCALQKPVRSDATPSGYGCLPNWGYSFSYSGEGCGQPDPKTGELVPVECGKLTLCYISEACICAVDGCISYPDDGLKLDLVVNGDKLDGSIVGVSPSVHNVHLSRQK